MEDSALLLETKALPGIPVKLTGEVVYKERCGAATTKRMRASPLVPPKEDSHLD